MPKKRLTEEELKLIRKEARKVSISVIIGLLIIGALVIKIFDL